MLAAPVYRLDLLFMGNLLISFLLFWFAGTISWIRPRWWRLLLTAGLGSGLALAPVVAPWGRWLLSGPGLVVASVLLTSLLAWPCTARQWWALFSGLWIAVGVTGGGALLLTGRRGLAAVAVGDEGILALPDSLGRQAGPPALWVTLGVVAALLGLVVVWQTYRERQAIKQSLYQVRIGLGEQETVLTGLLDSGNSLCTPVARRPVVVVEAELLRRSLPPAILEALSLGWEGLTAVPEEWRSRCQMIPYTAVGSREDALLLALTPDHLSVWDGQRGRWIDVNGTVGLTLKSLDPQGSYQALLPLRILREAEGK